MTDSPPKRRAGFQLHLSTCVVLMVVAGVLIWANVQTYPAALMLRSDGKIIGFLRHDSSQNQGVGWPSCFYIYRNNPLPIFGSLFPEESNPPIGDWDVGHLIGNVLIAATILLCTACTCEWFIRRRERKRLEVKP